jgi:hypothetical protein
MIVGFMTTYAISAYHHWCEFESPSDEVYSVQHNYVIKFVCDLHRWFSLGTPVSSTNKTEWSPRYNWNIVESGVKHHKPTSSDRFPRFPLSYGFWVKLDCSKTVAGWCSCRLAVPSVDLYLDLVKKTNKVFSL